MTVTLQTLYDKHGFSPATRNHVDRQEAVLEELHPLLFGEPVTAFYPRVESLVVNAHDVTDDNITDWHSFEYHFLGNGLPLMLDVRTYAKLFSVEFLTSDTVTGMKDKIKAEAAKAFLKYYENFKIRIRPVQVAVQQADKSEWTRRQGRDLLNNYSYTIAMFKRFMSS